MGGDCKTSGELETVTAVEHKDSWYYGGPDLKMIFRTWNEAFDWVKMQKIDVDHQEVYILTECVLGTAEIKRRMVVDKPLFA